MIDYGTTIRLTQKLGTAAFRYNSIKSVTTVIAT